MLAQNGLALRKKREPMELQLTAMIDIFSMIVIFLILGSVFGAADIVIPSGTTIPRSSSQEISATAPTLTVERSGIGLSIMPEKLSWESVRAGGLPESYKARIKQHIDGLTPEAKGVGIALNVVADQNTTYRDVFDAVRAFREAGFSMLLFVASSEGSK